MAIIRGTTPIIEFKYTDVDVDDITVAKLVVKQLGAIKIEKDLASATVAQSSLSWKLTQEETLSLESKKQVTIVCDWKLSNGTRGRSNVLTTETGEPGKNEVI